MAVSTNLEVGRLVDQIERSFHGGAWHGPATREVLSGVDATTAGRRPQGSPHTIYELVRHVTFWFDAAHRRIADGCDVGSESDWREGGVPTEESWRDAVAELENAYTRLRAVLSDLDDTRLDDAVPGSDPTVRGLLLGTLQHNAYHTGQIVQLAREIAR